MNPEIFAALRNTLATLYPDESDIRRLVADAGLDSARISFNSTAINDWHSVLTEAEKLNRIDELLAVVDQEYGSNWEFQKARVAYLRGRKGVQHPSVPLIVSKYLPLLLGMTIGEAVLGVLFFRYQYQYLIDQDKYWLLAGLWIFVVLAWWKLFSRQNRTALTIPGILIVAILTIAWVGYLGNQIWAIINPPKIFPDRFGIAVATFGQGTKYAVTNTSYEISERLYRDLQVAIANDSDLTNKVAVQRVGVVESAESAIARGNAINAKLVIWGYLESTSSKVDVYFDILQASDFIDNPAFPQTIPLTTHILRKKLSLSYDPMLDLGITIAEPSLGIADFSFGLAHYFERNYELAVRQFSNALYRLQPDWVELCQSKPIANAKGLGLIYFYLGKSYQILGDFTESQNFFDCAAKYDPDDLALLLGQAYNYRALGDEEQGRKTYREAIRISRNHSWEDKQQAAYNRAIAFEYVQEYENALREYQAIITEKPDFFVAYLGAGGMLIQLERFGEAAAVFQQAESIVTTDPVRQLWLTMSKGQLFEKRGDTQAAIQAYQKVIELDTQQSIVAPYFYLARLYAETGATKEARQNYQKLIEISQVPAWAYGVYGNFLSELGDYPAAIEQLKLALIFARHDDPVLHIQLALAYAAVDERHYPDKESRALAQFEAALKTPSPIEAYIRGEYGRILSQFHRREEAIEQLQLSIAANKSNDSVARFNLAFLHELQGETAKAIELYNSLLQICDQIPGHILHLVLKHLEALNIEPTACATLPQG